MTDTRDDCTFHEWLDSWFYTDTADDEVAPGGKFRLYWCDLPRDTTVTYLTRLFRDGGVCLALYSNAQLNEGLWELLGASGVPQILFDATLPPPTVTACIEGMVSLFRDVFAKRCAPVLGHLDEPGGNPLNSICYMWWDVFPVLIGTDKWYESVLLRVLETQLRIEHDAVRESALHGLGHVVGSLRSTAESIIDDFVARSPDARPELRRYANCARAGCIL